jgi:hypothetical protein
MIAAFGFGHVDERALAGAAERGRRSLTTEAIGHVDRCRRCARLLVGHERAFRLLDATWQTAFLADRARGAASTSRARLWQVALITGAALVAILVGATALGWGPLSIPSLPPDVVLATRGSEVVAVDLQTGETTVVAPGGIVALARDRTMFIRTAHDGAFVTGIDGTDLVKIKLPLTESPGLASWSPDGREAILYTGGFVHLDVATGNVSPFPFPEGWKDVGAGSWSPDGRQVAVNGPACLGVTDPLGGHLRVIGSREWACWGAEWSPDGSRIATSVLDQGIAIFTPEGDLLAQVDGMWPSWSPDSARLAFFRDRGLWVADATGANARRLTDASNFVMWPRWSADETQIVYQDSDRLWVVDVRSGRRHLPPVPAGASPPQYAFFDG